MLSRLKYIKYAAGILTAFLLITAVRCFAVGTLPNRKPDLYGQNTEVYISSEDADGDGIDDQTDILAGAAEYIRSRPKYKSRYYGTGYPDDGYGTCVDVVGYALNHAGYDLMKMVSDDISADPDAYGITLQDPAIDFRRVKNLKVYFSRHAVRLTDDIRKTGEWQGGDIVIFDNHIGIVSDRRNRDGIPYVIHHSGPFQLYYEEDILQSRNDLYGHFRIS
ncbi:MAG: DUF1287 domain-containing protein [Solobacterium sp.]|nr:DUF1287 domain-containing protein [Solobacterium sp.]